MTGRLYILAVIAVLSGCVDDAPHDNPLDPLSPKYVNQGDLIGRLMIAHQQKGVAGAFVKPLDGEIFVTTDSSGYFFFSGLSEGEHHFLCSKENFTSDTFSVAIIPRSVATIVHEMNAAPVAVSKNILARKIDHVSYNPEYFIEVSADVMDPNGGNELDSVWFEVSAETKSYLFPLEYSLSAKKFVATLFQSSFPTNTTQWLVGKALHIISRDTLGAVNISTPFFLSRVIENAATPLYPSGSITVKRDSVYLKWTPPDVAFNYSVTLTIYRTQTEQIVTTISNIISFFEKYPTDGGVMTLEPGSYFWTVTIVDDFGNYSRSKESYFVVE
jgi:hypothetical protein